MTTEPQRYGGDGPDGRERRSPWRAMRIGLTCRCPRCGRGALFARFTATVDRCAHCGEAIHHHRADDLPAYLVVFIVGHVVVGAFMGAEQMLTLSTWQHLAIWVPLATIASVALLRPVKGAVVGLQWALYMHGFGGDDEVIESHPERDDSRLG